MLSMQARNMARQKKTYFSHKSGNVYVTRYNLNAVHQPYRLKTSRPTTSTQMLITDDTPITISAITTVLHITQQQ